MNGGVALSKIDPEAKKLATGVVTKQESTEANNVANHEKAMDDAHAEATKGANSVRKARILQMGGNVSALIQKGDPSLGSSDETFTKGKAEAANVTST